MYVETKNKGFTLIEIMIAVAIVGLLAGLGSVGIWGYLERAKKKTTIARLKQLRTSIATYKLDMGKNPTRLDDLIRRPSDPKLASRWSGPYGVEEAEDLEDSYENRIQYKQTPGSAHPYELYSFGEKGPGSEERISVWVAR